MSDAANIVGRIIRSFGAFLIWAVLALGAGASEPQIHDRASNGDFTGIALVTDDLNWFEQFSRPETPQIHGQDRFVPGETGAIAVVFSNAAAKGGQVLVQCALSFTDVDGSTRDLPPGTCYEGPAYPPDVLYPSLLDLRFTISEEDPAGLVGFTIGLTDVNSGRSVELEVSFYQGAAE